MDDLISRQDAIDAINQICPIETEYDCTLLDRVDVRCVLTELPSAEPEQRWISCGDCKHYKIDHPRANGYHCCYRMHSIFPMKPDDFCSYGERREDERLNKQTGCD